MDRELPAASPLTSFPSSGAQATCFSCCGRAAHATGKPREWRSPLARAGQARDWPAAGTAESNPQLTGCCREAQQGGTLTAREARSTARQKKRTRPGVK